MVTNLMITSLWSFVTIAAIQSGSPGPSTMLAINNAVNYGKVNAIIALTGDVLGIFVLSSFASLGLTKIMDSIPYMYNLMAIFGGSYLIWLSYKYWRKDSANLEIKSVLSTKSLKKLWINSFLVSVTNPKALIFFSAIFPIFISGSGHMLFGLLLSMIFCITKQVVLSSYIVFSDIFSERISTKNGQNVFNKATAFIFLFFGLAMMTSSVIDLK